VLRLGGGKDFPLLLMDKSVIDLSLGTNLKYVKMGLTVT